MSTSTFVLLICLASLLNHVAKFEQGATSWRPSAQVPQGFFRGYVATPVLNVFHVQMALQTVSGSQLEHRQASFLQAADWIISGLWGLEGSHIWRVKILKVPVPCSTGMPLQSVWESKCHKLPEAGEFRTRWERACLDEPRKHIYRDLMITHGTFAQQGYAHASPSVQWVSVLRGLIRNWAQWILRYWALKAFSTLMTHVAMMQRNGISEPSKNNYCKANHVKTRSDMKVTC